MDQWDALLLAILAAADLVALLYVRRRRARRKRMERMSQLLAEAVRREAQTPVRRRILRAAPPAPYVTVQ